MHFMAFNRLEAAQSPSSRNLVPYFRYIYLPRMGLSATIRLCRGAGVKDSVSCGCCVLLKQVQIHPPVFTSGWGIPRRGEPTLLVAGVAGDSATDS
jgi:hypothetical protein